MLALYVNHSRKISFDKIVAELNSLKAEIEAIQIEYSKKFPEEIEEIRAEEREVVQDESAPTSVHRPDDVDLSQLIKRIAQVCHPDKTSDPALNSMLVDALEARDKNPEIVIHIYETLFKTSLNIDDDLYSRKVQELANLKSSGMYRVLQYHKQQDKIKAKMSFLEILNNKLTRLRNSKRRSK